MTSTAARPRVSCVMPTYNRRAFVPRAIRYFQRQDYPDRELIVVDDGTDPVADLVPADAGIRYLRLGTRHTIGAKRTIGCREAGGALVVHWDDDDWMAPTRLSLQVTALLAQDVDVSGLRTQFFLNPTSGQCWRYEYPHTLRPWVAEPTFCYRREFGLARPFPDQDIASGTDWLWHTPGVKIGPMAEYSYYVGIIHSGNTAAKNTSSGWWRPIPQREVAAVLGADWPLDTCVSPTTSNRTTAPCHADSLPGLWEVAHRGRR
jgi:glycosyltransferase involved in cell wall biosynthesis